MSQIETASSSRPPHRRPRLTDRQRACLELAAKGCSSADIGRRLSVSPRTVDEHLAMACRTLGVRTRIQAVARIAADRSASAVRPPHPQP